uniref:Uncharacterized protein n=1 Tax=Sipha flava TaxID=143950 RepID=A0A2S2Q093_9HEMI
MKVWHRRCRPVKHEVVDRTEEPVVVASAAVAEESKGLENSISSTIKAVVKFSEYPRRRIRSIQTADVAQEPSLYASLDLCPATAPRLIVAPATENVRIARAVSLDAWSMFGHPINWPGRTGAGVCLERLFALRLWPIAVRPVAPPKSENDVLFARSVPDEHQVRVIVRTADVEKSVVTADTVVELFSHHPRTAASALDWYGQLLPAGCWLLPAVFQWARPTINAAATGNVLLATVASPLAAPLAGPKRN